MSEWDVRKATIQNRNAWNASFPTISALASDTAPSIDELATKYPDLADQIRHRLVRAQTESAGAPSTKRQEETELTEQWAPEQEQESPHASTFVYTGGSSAADAGAEPRSIHSGDKVGSYRLIRQLGQGGMGVVYEAEHDASGRRVALKLLSPDLPRTRETIDRFLNEANLAAALSHPRTTFVYEAGEVEGDFFIAMERMPRRTLRDEVQERGRLPVPQAVDFALDVLEGLDAAAQGRSRSPRRQAIELFFG